MSFATFHRWLYRGGRPNALARALNRGWAVIHSLGILPNYMVTLEVMGRRSGRTISFPLAMVLVDGERFLVSMLGTEAAWVRNLRAVNGHATLRHGQTEQVLLEEVVIGKRARILKAYLRIAPGARPHIPIDKDAPLEAFETIAAQIPVFQVHSLKTVSKSPSSESSVLPFFALVLVLLVPFLILGEIRPLELLPGLPISALGAFTPAFAALILRYKNGGVSGFLRLLQRSFDLQRIRNKNWLIMIFLINPVIAISAYGMMRMTGVSLPPVEPWTLSIFPLFIAMFIAALGEEIGWTGYATGPLVERWGRIPAGLLLGGFWTVIHFIPLVQVHRSVEWIVWWSLGTISYRLIMVWFYTHTGKSVFAAALFHAMINLCWQLFPNSGSHYDPRIFGLMTFAFAIALYAIERFLSRNKLRVA